MSIEKNFAAHRQVSPEKAKNQSQQRFMPVLITYMFDKTQIKIKKLQGWIQDFWKGD